MKIIILGNSIGFPIGLAATARVRCIAKGLIEEGHVVEVVNSVGLAKTYTKEKVSSTGISDGIPYRFCGGFSVRPESKLGRITEKLIGDIVSLTLIRQKKIKRQLDCVIMYSRSFFFIHIFGLLCKSLHIPLIVELCEWPEAIATTKGYHLARAKRFSRLVIKGLSGFPNTNLTNKYY